MKKKKKKKLNSQANQSNWKKKLIIKTEIGHIIYLFRKNKNKNTIKFV